MEIVGTRRQILMAKCTKIYTLPPLGAYGASTLAPSALVSAPRPLGASLLTPLAFGCLTEAKAHPTSSFWRRHCVCLVLLKLKNAKRHSLTKNLQQS